ncbi:hypothetical protein BG004_004950, partial [Podila humilis]
MTQLELRFRYSYRPNKPPQRAMLVFPTTEAYAFTKSVEHFVISGLQNAKDDDTLLVNGDIIGHAFGKVNLVTTRIEVIYAPFHDPRRYIKSFK